MPRRLAFCGLQTFWNSEHAFPMCESCLRKMLRHRQNKGHLHGDSVHISTIFMPPAQTSQLKSALAIQFQALLLRIVAKKAVANDQSFDVSTHRNSKRHPAGCGSRCAQNPCVHGVSLFRESITSGSPMKNRSLHFFLIAMCRQTFAAHPEHHRRRGIRKKHF